MKSPNIQILISTSNILKHFFSQIKHKNQQFATSKKHSWVVVDGPDQAEPGV